MVETIIPAKKCFKCERVLLLVDFYAHSNKCKECTKLGVRLNYAAKREQYAAYERERWLRPERRAFAMDAQRKRRARHPEKNRARLAVSNALRDGKLVRLPCEVCGNQKSQAHHDDYSKPLEVRWLCFAHHRMEHGQLSHLKQVAQYRAAKP